MPVVLTEAAVRKLQLLKCPNTQKQISDDEARRLVLWLEDTKIRLLTTKEREKLRSRDRDEWLSALTSYLCNLGVIPLPLPGTLPTNVDWDQQPCLVIERLIALALQDLYLDARDNKELSVMPDDPDRPSSPSPEDSKAEAGEQPFSKAQLQRCVGPMNAILSHFGLPLLPTKGITEAMLASAMQAVVTRIAPEPCKQSHRPKLDLPLGTKIEDQDLRNFMVVLRLLHTQKLRKMQEHVNEIITELQVLTADIRTDLMQGRVGV